MCLELRKPHPNRSRDAWDLHWLRQSPHPSLIWRGVDYLRDLRRLGVPVLHRHVVHSAAGGGAIQQASIVAVAPDGEPVRESERGFEVDALCVGYRLRPSTELLESLGCQHQFAEDGTVLPVRDEFGRTSIENVYSVGDGASIGGAQVAMSEGRIAAREILNRPALRRDIQQLRRQKKFQRHLWAMFAAPVVRTWADSTIVCRCESVTAAQIRSAIAAGAQDANAVKQMTRTGMGVCQGRYCKPTLRVLLGQTANTTSADLRARLPAKPFAIGTVAAEKPEWLGYRQAAVQPSAPRAGTCAKQRRKTDVLVIGGGIVGAASAMYLARSGFDVTVVDRAAVNGEASGGNAGSLHLQLLPFDFRESETTVASPCCTNLAATEFRDPNLAVTRC